MKNQAIFPPEEFAILETSLAAKRFDIQLEYQEAVNALHHGRPVIVQTVHLGGGPGCPRIHINQDFLQWAYGQQPTAGISRFIGLGRTTIRNVLLEYGIAELQQTPSQLTTSFTGPMSDISDDDLDMLLLCLHTHYWWPGLSMLNGMVCLQASDNNTADTVLELFLNAANVYGVPSQMCRDHRAENLYVTTWIENYCGNHRGSYIWGR
ncbi:hypothetical protein K438DRAFT_1555956 [Mycena galopus ATCC 62051]|nr:hypothetical protein K438DRAFT_1555956 [Mycena galopus ATCC 62051]